MHLGNLQWSDAEDVVSRAFEILYSKSLLESWLSRPEARFFLTLLCTVVRNVVINAVRSRQSAAWNLADQIQQALDKQDEIQRQGLVAFYGIWAEGLLRAAVQAVMSEEHRKGKGDYFRVLYGRICEPLSVKEIAEQLDLKTTDVDNPVNTAKGERLSQSSSSGQFPTCVSPEGASGNWRSKRKAEQVEVGVIAMGFRPEGAKT